MIILITPDILRCKFIKLDKFEENFVLKTCICKVLIYKAVGTLNFHFLILNECGAIFKKSQIGVNAWHAGYKVAIFTVRTPYQPPKFENLTLNQSEFWYTPKAASSPIGLLMINIKLIPFQHT